MSDQPHSAELFGEQRDFWWNRDFLDLMAARWRLHEAASLADIGCGVGHWSRLLYPYLRPPARLAGVDREPRWVAEAPKKFHRDFPHVAPELFSFHQGDATKLPLDDESFDVVTCQTVLMHLAQPLDALREMLRILRPGGLLVCVEPNNFWNYLAFTSLTEDEPVETLVRRFEFWLRQHRGRLAAGRGNHSLGDLLPGQFAQLGLRDIAVHQNDRPAPLFPPYAGADQKSARRTGTPVEKFRDRPVEQRRPARTFPARRRG
jgi:ubiquinone/menaquinone biosynthesis C-methylase UbiE